MPHTPTLKRSLHVQLQPLPPPEPEPPAPPVLSPRTPDSPPDRFRPTAARPVSLDGAPPAPPAEEVAPLAADAGAPPAAEGTAVLTLNLANGRADEYRTGENRAAQAALIAQSGAEVVALQEVDTGLPRTGGVNTALDIVRRFDPSFEALADQPLPPPTADGTRVFAAEGGTLVMGESFSGDDREDGLDGSHASDATYGNAFYVAAPNQVTDSYTVALPHDAQGSDPEPADPSLLAALADGTVSDEERALLGERNDAIRAGAESEPRTALVTRVVDENGVETSYINVHLTADDPDIRSQQLAYLNGLVQAEANGPPARDVVVMGDFNATTAEVEQAFEGTGLHREVGGSSAGIHNFDQVWSTREGNDSAQVSTQGTSDHPNAGYTVIE